MIAYGHMCAHVCPYAVCTRVSCVGMDMYDCIMIYMPYILIHNPISHVYAYMCIHIQRIHVYTHRAHSCIPMYTYIRIHTPTYSCTFIYTSTNPRIQHTDPYMHINTHTYSPHTHVYIPWHTRVYQDIPQTCVIYAYTQLYHPYISLHTPHLPNAHPDIHTHNPT